LFVLLFSLASAQVCPDATTTLNDAVQQLILLDEEAFTAELERLDRSLSCAWIDPENLAMLWLLRGAQRHLSGDEAGTREAFATAQAIAPDLWLDVLGGPLRATYDDELRKPRPKGQLDLTGVGDATVRIDGKARQLPVSLIAGTHLLQIGVDGEVVERHDVVVVADQGAVVDLGRQPAPVEVPESPEGLANAVGLSLWGGAGFGFVQGEAVTAGGRTEPARKLSLPLETGAALHLGPAWVRGQASWAPLLQGQLLYLSGEEVRDTSSFLHLGGAVGASVAGFHAGVLGTATLPSRVGLRGLLGRDLIGPMGVELRGGVNLHPARSAEPAFEAVVRVQPQLR